MEFYEASLFEEGNKVLDSKVSLLGDYKGEKSIWVIVKDTLEFQYGKLNELSLFPKKVYVGKTLKEVLVEEGKLWLDTEETTNWKKSDYLVMIEVESDDTTEVKTKTKLFNGILGLEEDLSRYKVTLDKPQNF